MRGGFQHTPTTPHISFPRRCGGSGERSEPIGAPLAHSTLSRQKTTNRPRRPFRHADACHLPRAARGRLFIHGILASFADARRLSAYTHHTILASPADAGERSTSSNHTSPFGLCSWEVFPYDLLPAQLRPSGLLLGQVSKWRATRADRGASCSFDSLTAENHKSTKAPLPSR